jgi:transposase
MSYSIDARAMVLRYRDNGHSLEETHKEFGVSISTIRDWERLREENGELSKRKLNRVPRIYPGEELQSYVKEHPDAFLHEIAEHFGGTAVGAFNALKREGITYKKRL